MTLPLQDNKNPLFGLSPIEMCRKLAGSGTDIKPWELLSLDRSHYTEKHIKKAYTQLSINIHPDKNLQIQNLATQAFTILGQAREYMTYGLKSAAEKRKEYSSIANNPFYQKYGNRGFSAESQNSGNVESGFYFDADWNPQRRGQTASQKKSYEQMSFIELAAEANNGNTIPEAIITRLKQFIWGDNSLVDLEFSLGILHQRMKIIHIAISQRAEEFTIWLLEQGANPFVNKGIRLALGLYMLETDIVYPVIYNNLLKVMHYLLNRQGASFFYMQEENTSPQPIWGYLEEAIEDGHSSIAQFLLYDADYLKFINNHKFDRQWKECANIKDYSELTSLLIRNNLLANLEEALYHAMQKNSIAAAKEILKQKPKYTIKKLFTAYLSYTPKNSMQCVEEPIESLELMLHLFHQKSHSALDVKSILNHTVKNCSRRPILLTLIPHLYKCLNQYQLPTREEIPFEKQETQLSKEAQQSGLLSACYAIAELANYELLKELLDISSAPILDARYRYATPIFSMFISVAKQEVSTEHYDGVLSLLINLGGPALSVTHNFYEDDTLREEYNYCQYKNYSLLHLACELGLQKQALHLLDKMREEKKDLNTVCIKKIRAPQSESFTHYHYTALHQAIINKNPDLAVKLIQAGIDYKINAIIEQPKTHTFCFFSKNERVEKTTLQLAIEGKQTHVIRALQIRMLNDYLAQRKEEDHYLSRITIFGYTLFSFGYFNKTTKIKAAEHLKEALRQGQNDLNQLEKNHIAALSQGRLGEIAQLSNHLKNTTIPNENTQRQYRFR